VTGAQAVESALSLLHPLGTSADTHAAHKGSGVLGSAVQYAKELLPRWSISGPSQTSEKRKEQTHLSRRLLSEGVALLQEAANQKNPDAMFLLAEMNFYGNFSHPRNYSEAFRRYKDLSALDSNSSAQHMVGFMHATGLGNAVERDQAKALLYHTFAAEAGNIKSQMTVAYRYYTGIGTPRNCDRAAAYYKKVADQAIQWYRSGPPGGRTWSVDSFHLADADGGVYGEGASVSSAGINAQKAGPGSDAHASLDDVLEYLELMSGKGDYKATFSLGRIHYEGQKGLKRDYKAARKYFLIVANHYWKKGSASSEKPEKQDLEKLACKAAGYLGRMHLRGEGMEENYKHAKKWFDRGSKGGDAGSNNGLGLMYQHGLGVKKDLVQAADRFRAAADHDHPSAQVSLGAMYLDQGSPEDIGFATMLFELAKRYGHIEAYYYLAELANQGIGRERNCGTATAYYKLVAERAEPLLSSFAEANRAYESGDYELAMIDYLLNAEQGYEKAQANVAYLLDEQKSVLGLPAPSIHRKPNPSLLKDPQLALIYWTRSAKQSNTDAMVKMGDYYLNGIGTDPDMEKAASCYTAASEYHQSAQALYNLGWMHENGLGLTQDFHLAKRYYDQALEVNHEAYLPVTLSLFKLRARSAWNTLTNGRINSIRDEPGMYMTSLFP
jgi:SEL1 protein